MFLYYLVDLQGPHPQILYLYFGEQSHVSKEELIKQTATELNRKSLGTISPEKIVYSRVPLTEICGIDQLCHSNTDQRARNIYFFYLGGYEFYYAIGQTLDDAVTCVDRDLNHERWSLIEKIVKDEQYDEFSLDLIKGHPIHGSC